MNKIQNSKLSLQLMILKLSIQTFRLLDIEILDIIWNLCIEIWNLRPISRIYDFFFQVYHLFNVTLIDWVTS